MKKSFYTLLAFSLFTAGIFFISCKPEIHEHTYSDQWTVDEEYHWYEATCEHTTEIKGKSAHIWDDGTVTKEATEAAEGEKTYTCTICKTTKTEVIAKLSHTHNYSTEWTSDATQHWHACSGCEEKGDLTNHEWDEGKETSKTEITYTCTVCGATKTESTEKKEEEEPVKSKYPNDVNPLINSNAAISQDFIFNTNSVGFTTITIRRSEWNKMLTYYDYFYKNENTVIAESYEYTKDGKSWKLNTVGLRLRGNTSRFRPQGKDYTLISTDPSKAKDECGNNVPNAGWSKDYYIYAQTCSDDTYRQSHFKVDFEPLDDDDRKLSDCMKGVALKRSDSLFSKEIFCYYLFHQYGIWTAPRASQTKVKINIVEDLESDGSAKENISNCTVTKIDYGVYEMFEEVNKQSLKGRTKKSNSSSTTWKKNYSSLAWTNNGGDLWKCSGGDLTAGSNTASNFGCEQIEILNADKDKSEWDTIWHNPCYDLKTNKKELDRATAHFQNFITELNDLSNTNASSQTGITARKNFYEKWFDVDFFIKTYAVNILVGMDDDYWGNANNYYLYFDNGKNGSGKCYFIPFDYDNTLGSSINRDKVYVNPLEWGYNENSDTKVLTKKDRPLLDRLLEVPEYVQKMKESLLEVASQDTNSPWNKDNCFAVWNKLQGQVSPYIYSPDLTGSPDISSIGISDSGGWKSIKHYLTQEENNIYEQTYLNFIGWLSDSDIEITFDLNGGTLDGVTGTKTGLFNGANAKFETMMGIPERSGYEFLGWTLTKNGSDYKTEYKGETDLTVYASWVDISSYTGLSIFEIKDSTYEGIKIGIINLPENHYRRNFYINGKEVGGDSQEDGSQYGKIWAYPFTEEGKTYEIYVKYKNKDYGTLETSNSIEITAESGKGEFKLLNTPSYTISNNCLNWTTAPIIQIGNGISPKASDNWDEYYLLEVQSTKQIDASKPEGYNGNWAYQSWNYLGATAGQNFNFKTHVEDEVLSGSYYDLKFRLSYQYKSNPYGNLFFVLYDYSDVEEFNIE